MAGKGRTIDWRWPLPVKIIGNQTWHLVAALFLLTPISAHGQTAGGADLNSISLWFAQNWIIAVWLLLLILTLHVLRLNRRILAHQKQAQAADEIFRDLAQASADWIWRAGPSTKIDQVSDGFERVTGYAAESLHGLNWHQFNHIGLEADQRKRLELAVAMRLAIQAVRAVVTTAEEEKKHIQLSGWPFYNEKGNFAGYRGIGIDMTDLVAAQNRIQFLSDHDELTGLPNRTMLGHRLASLLRDPAEMGHKPSLIAVDIERFRSINEGYGSSAGDHLIKQFATRLVEAMGPHDMIARYSNTEFIILCERIGGMDPLPAKLSRLHDTLGESFKIDNDHISVNSRLGVYELAPGDGEAELCIKRVQIALATSKRESQFVTIYASGMDQEAEVRRRLEDDLKPALANESLHLVYQPQMSLQTGHFTGAEALMRWLHPTLGEISPTEFIPLAEHNGMITELSLWALRTACSDLKMTRNLSLSVNISALDFKQTDLVIAMENIINEFEVEPNRIELEVTEGVLITDDQVALDMLNRLKSSGFCISLDDFGTGYAGLGYLQLFPFDKLKIDRSFVRRLGSSKHADAIVRSVISLAHDLGLQVVAEGVERREQMEHLKLAGCDIVQGFILGQAVRGDQLANFEPNPEYCEI